MSSKPKPNLYQDIMDVLMKHAEADDQYWNPHFLCELNSLLEEYGNIEDRVVDKWISDMWGW